MLLKQTKKNHSTAKPVHKGHLYAEGLVSYKLFPIQLYRY